MRALDRFIGPLLLFTFGYFAVYWGSGVFQHGELPMTVQGVRSVVSPAQNSKVFWSFVIGSLSVGGILIVLSFVSAISVVRIWGSPRQERQESRLFLRLIAIFFIGVIVMITIQAFRTGLI